MKNSRGFTAFEMVLVMVIMGIMAALTFVKYQKTVAANELDRAANNLYMELRSLRSLGLRYDAKVRARFNPVAEQCTVWVDTMAVPVDGVWELKLIRIHQIPPPIKIGRSPSGGTYTDPYADVPNWCYPHQTLGYYKGCIGSWRCDGWLDVYNSVSDQYEGGGVYLYNPRLDKTTYFIGIAWQHSQSIEIKKWNGTSWDDL